MSINFKIFFKKSLESKDNNIVLLRGNLLKFKWDELREKIVQNSHNSFFESKNLDLNEDHKFYLKIKEPQNFDDLSISNDDTFNIFIEKIKKYQNDNPNKQINLRFTLEENANKNIQNFNKSILKKTLENIWEIVKEKIKSELNELELVKSKVNYLNNNLDEDEDENELNPEQKKINSVTCNNCLSVNFYGYRYVCSYCDNYNLCYKCYKKNNHNENHNFILFRKPILEEYNINEYNNKFSPNFLFFEDKKEKFPVKFNIANTGKKDIKNCFIGFIKFDINHLSCKKNVFEIAKNETKEITLEIDFSNIDNINFNTFEGHFRMFNKNGIPFGDILKIKIKNGYVLKEF